MLEYERHNTIHRLLDLKVYTTLQDVVETTGASETNGRHDFFILNEVKNSSSSDQIPFKIIKLQLFL